MKAIILSAALVFNANFLFAEDKAPATASEQNQDYVQMHESMAKAHQQAADCLKSGKSVDECRNTFYEMCQGSGGPDKCGPWRMRLKTERKGK